jgi:hypothetical protein
LADRVPDDRAGETNMTTKTNLKSGGWSTNHNETLVRAMPKTNITWGRKFLGLRESA